jgi:hypothetical protein
VVLEDHANRIYDVVGDLDRHVCGMTGRTLPCNNG